MCIVRMLDSNKQGLTLWKDWCKHLRSKVLKCCMFLMVLYDALHIACTLLKTETSGQGKLHIGNNSSHLYIFNDLITILRDKQVIHFEEQCCHFEGQQDCPF